MGLRLRKVKLAIEDGFYDIEDLVTLLEIRVEDVLERFEDRLVENAEKFGVYEYDSEEEQEEVENVEGTEATQEELEE